MQLAALPADEGTPLATAPAASTAIAQAAPEAPAPKASIATPSTSPDLADLMRFLAKTAAGPSPDLASLAGGLAGAAPTVGLSPDVVAQIFSAARPQGPPPRMPALAPPDAPAPGAKPGPSEEDDGNDPGLSEESFVPELPPPS